MTELYLLVPLILIAFVVLALLKAKLAGGEGLGKAEVYYLRKSLFSPAELRQVVMSGLLTCENHDRRPSDSCAFCASSRPIGLFQKP